MIIDKYKLESRNFFNKSYNTKYGNSNQVDKYIIDFVKDGDFKNILDVSCGTGRTIYKMVDEFGSISFKGIDISNKSIEFAKSRGIFNASFFVGEVDHLPFKDSEFSLVYNINSFHHYPNPEEALSEMYRVLGEGGKLFLADVFLINPFRSLVNWYLPYGHKGDYKIHSKKELIAMAEEAGFKFVKYKYINYCLFYSVFEKV